MGPGSYARRDLYGRSASSPHRQYQSTMAAFLVLSIAFNTIFASCYKIAVRRKCNLDVVNVWMYAGSVLTICAVVLVKGKLAYHPTALLMGFAAGVMVFFATLSFFYHMKYGQLSASWTVISLAVGFPVAASIIAWNEMPTPRQATGLALIVLALLLFGRHEANGGRSR